MFRTLTALTVILLAASPAFAQQQQNRNAPVRGQSQFEDPNFYQVPRGISVFERERQDYEPPAIRAGSFFINPAIGFSTRWSDNIFSSQDNQASDLLFITNPSIRVQSDWSRHSLTLRAGSEMAAYADNSSQNYTDALLGVNGAYDILRGFTASGGVTFQHLHEERGSPNSVVGNLSGPNTYSLTVYNAGLTRQTGVVGFDADFDTLRWDYDNNDGLNNDVRDRTDYVGTLTVFYEFMRDYKAFVRGILNSRQYDDQFDLTGLERDSDGWETQLGADVNLTDVITGEAYVGYTQQDYKDQRFDSVDAVTFGTSLLWNVTGLTSLRGGVDREIRDSVLNNVSSYLQTTYSLSLEHELRRNVLVGSSLQYINYEFEGNNISRNDDFYRATVGARYLMGRNITTGIDYSYRERASDVSGIDFHENAVQGNVTFGF